MLFIAGEEISWGQRIFGWTAPSQLDNEQHETTIHNTAHVLKRAARLFLTARRRYLGRRGIVAR